MTNEIQKQDEKGYALSAWLSDDRVMKRFEQAAGVNAGKLIVSIINAANNSPDLWKCEPQSVITAGLNAAALDLSLAPALGQACIVAYRKNYKDAKGTWQTKYVAQFQPMVRGLMAMALRTNKYRWINKFFVYEGQEVVEDQISGDVKIQGSRTSKEITHYGAAFEMMSGYRKTIVWSKEKCYKHGEYSPTFDKKKGEFNKSSRWVTHFDEQASKSVMRHILLHYGEISDRDRQLLDVIESDAEIVDAEMMTIEDDEQGGVMTVEDALELHAPDGRSFRALTKKELIEVANDEAQPEIVRDAAQMIADSREDKTEQQNLDELGFGS